MQMKHYCISFEGIDKTGKELVGKYVDILGKHKYVLMDRGLISNITYARMYGREYEYDVEQFRNWVFVHLVCDEADWKVRCKLTKEPEIDFFKNTNEFAATFKNFRDLGFNVLTFNTSHYTPYDIATMIIQHMEKLNEERN